MKLYFLRHAPAYSRDEWDGRDSERPLSEDGLKTAIDIAEAIAALDLGLSAILSSPFERALRTAVVLRDRLTDPPPLVEEPGLEPSSFSLSSLMKMLEPYGDTAAVLVVGHEPSMTGVLEALLGGGRYALKKGSLVRVDVDPREPTEAVLKWFATPRLLRARRTDAR